MPAIVSDEQQERDVEMVGAYDDVQLIYVMLGLNAEIEGAPAWGKTQQAGYLRRMLFTEIVRRWIPPAVFADAFARLMEEPVDA